MLSTTFRGRIILSLVLQVTKVRPREVEKLAQDHREWRWQSWDLDECCATMPPSSQLKVRGSNGREGLCWVLGTSLKSLGHSYCSYSIVRQDLVLITILDYRWLIFSSFSILIQCPKRAWLIFHKNAFSPFLLGKNKETLDFKENPKGLESIVLNPSEIFHLVWVFLFYTHYFLSTYYLTMALLQL